MDRKDPQQRTSEHQCPFTEMSSRPVTLLKLQHNNLGIRSYLGGSLSTCKRSRFLVSSRETSIAFLTLALDTVHVLGRYFNL